MKTDSQFSAKAGSYKTAFTTNNECVGLSNWNSEAQTFTVRFISGECMDNVPSSHLSDFVL